jgi:hypothetical protein
MMAVFDMITCAPPEIVDQKHDISRRHFTIDTADIFTVQEWIDFNPYIVTYAVIDGECLGFFTILPITTECAAQFDEQSIKEEDVGIEHILPHSVMEHAQYAYLAAIAIKEKNNYINRQCAASLVSTMCDYFLNAYDPKNLKRIYANPTTFNGNHLVRKMGLAPVVSYKKPLKGNDIYAIDMTKPETIEGMEYLSKRYSRFVGSNPWSAKK